MVNVLTIFLQNINIQYHVVLKVCKYFFTNKTQFSYDTSWPLERHQQSVLLIIYGWICNTGILEEQDWNG